MGHYKGAAPGTASFRKALALLMQAVPKKKIVGPKQRFFPFPG
jgi:hypothetical protein